MSYPSNPSSEIESSENSSPTIREDIEADMDGFSNINKIGNRLDYQKHREHIDRLFKDILRELKCQNGHINDRLDEIDEFISNIGKRFKEVDQRFAPVNSKLNSIEDLMRNLRTYSPLDDTYPIGLYDPLNIHRSYLNSTSEFPHKDIQFWRLKERKNLSTLTTLLRFYGTTGWECWGETNNLFDNCKENWDADQLRCNTLEAAVTEYPEIALTVLASHLGLDFAKFEKIVTRFKKRNAQSQVNKGRAKLPRLEDQRCLKNSPRALPIGHRLPIIPNKDHLRERTYGTASHIAKVERSAITLSIPSLSSSVSRQASDENESEDETPSKSSEDEKDTMPNKGLQKSNKAAKRAP